MQEETFQIRNHAINCAIGPGSGAPLVLFHGVTRCWQDFNAIIPSLSERWQLFAMDHRGHGKSDWTARYRVNDFAADATAFVEQEVAAPAVLLGHSLGAMVAALVAANLPQHVRALILEDPPGTTLAEGIAGSRFALQFANTERLLADAADVESLTRALAEMEVQRPRDGVIVRFREIRDMNAIRFGAQCLLRIDPNVMKTLNEGRWLEGLDWFAALGKVRCPTLLLRADPALGGMLEEREAERIRSLIPGCTRADFAGTGHSIHSTEPEKMLALISEFLETNKLD